MVYIFGKFCGEARAYIYTTCARRRFDWGAMETDRSGKMRERVVLLIPEKSIICIQRTFLRWDGFRGLLYIYVLCSCCSFSLLRALAAEFGACARMMRGKSERYDGYCLGGVCTWQRQG